MKTEDLLAFQEVVRILGVTERALKRRIQDGDLEPVYMDNQMRFNRRDVRALFEGQQPTSSGRKARILIMDDDLLVGESLKNLLERNGYEVAVVSIGLAALDLAVQGTFDLVLSDVRMPGMNGVESLKAIRELREQARRPFLPEIILTGYDDPEVKHEAEQMGIRDFMLKPFDSSDLLAAIRRNLASKRRVGLRAQKC